MNTATAKQIKMGDYVSTGGEVKKVLSIKTSGIAAPLFRLEGDNGDLTSHVICRPHSRDGKLWSDELGFVSIPTNA